LSLAPKNFFENFTNLFYWSLSFVAKSLSTLLIFYLRKNLCGISLLCTGYCRKFRMKFTLEKNIDHHKSRRNFVEISWENRKRRMCTVLYLFVCVCSCIYLCT